MISCQKEKALTWSGDLDQLMEGMTYGQPPEPVYREMAFAGQFLVEPDVSFGYCVLPDRARIPMFRRMLIQGELDVFGRIDARQSFQDHEECTPIPEADIVQTTAVGTLVNANGDVLYYYGDAICHDDGKYEGRFCITGGTGAFSDATGWISVDFIVSSHSRSWEASVEGEVLLPRS